MIDRDKFTAWLQAKDPTEIVGYPRLPCECPLANFLNATLCDPNGGESINVGFSIYRICNEGTTTCKFKHTPPWARQFINAVDHYPQKIAIDASAALSMLDKIA